MRKGEDQNGQSASYYARSLTRREQQNEAEFQLGYLLASIEQSIHAYAEKTNYAYSVAHTAFRVSQILSSKALRQEPGLAQLLQQVRPNGATALLGAGNQPGEPEFIAEEEVHVRPRVGRPLGSGKQQILRVKDLGRPLTQEEKRTNWRLQAQALRDRRIAEGLNSQGRPPQRRLSRAGLEAIRKAQRASWKKNQAERVAAAVTGHLKRVLTPKQLRAMRRNAELARAARRAKPKKPMSAERRMELSKIMRAAYAKKRAAKAEQQGGAQQQ